LAYNTTLSVHIKRQTDRGYHEHWTVRLSTGLSDFEVVTVHGVSVKDRGCVSV
jgi:hypothetical protein